MKNAIKSVAPAWLLSAYHFFLAFLAALLYRFPSRRLVVVAAVLDDLGAGGIDAAVPVIGEMFSGKKPRYPPVVAVVGKDAAQHLELSQRRGGASANEYLIGGGCWAQCRAVKEGPVDIRAA